MLECRDNFSIMKYNIAVVDDVISDGELLQKEIRKCFSVNDNSSGFVTSFSDGETLLKDFEPGKFQIIFMDIMMSSISGIEAAKQIRASDSSALIVFTTSSDEFVFEAFPLHPFDYVLKPYDFDRINKIISEALKFFEKTDPFITVRVSRSRYKILLRNILAVQARDHFVELIMTMGNSLLCSMRFGEFEEMLKDDPRFLLCNRGVIINMDYVLSPSRNQESFIMNDSTHFAIKVRDRSKILHAFTQYQISRIRSINK